MKIDEAGTIQPSTHYWMNQLQGVSEKVNYFVSVNGAEDIDPSKVLRRIDYEHPLFSLGAVRAQTEIPALNLVALTDNTGRYVLTGVNSFGGTASVTSTVRVGP